jgi:phosphoribosylanthranilate isomerase
MFVPLQELFIKICGITNLADAEAACSLGANAIGFNFNESSERYIKPEAASDISKKLPDYISKIGVFRNARLGSIQNILRSVNLSAVQLEGNYAADDLVGYESSVIRVFLLNRTFDVEVMRNYLVDAFLLKNSDKGSSEAKKFHWDIALKAKEYGRVILSGGINPDNVEDAVRFVKPYGIDVCSGVECETGKKDFAKMRDLIAKARNIILTENEDDIFDDDADL